MLVGTINLVGFLLAVRFIGIPLSVAFYVL